MADLPRKLAAEAIGTLLLLAVVIGSGIMAERLAGGNAAIALLANALATVGGLYVLIEVFGPISGAHFNPAVSAVMAIRRELPRWAFLPYVAAQLVGAMLGAWLAHAMFDMTILQFSTRLRSGIGQWIAEAVATAGLLLVVLRAPQGRAAAMVAAYIGWIALFALLYGASNGVMTIVRGAIPAELYGQSNYGAVNGAMATPVLIAKAAGPIVAALVLVALAQATHLVLFLAAVAAVSAMLFTASALRRPAALDTVR